MPKYYPFGHKDTYISIGPPLIISRDIILIASDYPHSDTMFLIWKKNKKTKKHYVSILLIENYFYSRVF